MFKLEGRGHLYNRSTNPHFDFIKRARFDAERWFTPPKSKSPWEAMTSGSTGGWASFAGPSQPTNPNDPAGWGWVGPALTAGAGMIPGVGPLIATGMGAMGSMGGGTGFQGTDKGWGNVLPTLAGGLGGYGMGALGSGISGAVSGAFQGGTGGGLGGILGNAAQGFKSGIGWGAPAGGYLNTPIIPGIPGSSGNAISRALGGILGKVTGQGGGADVVAGKDFDVFLGARAPGGGSMLSSNVAANAASQEMINTPREQGGAKFQFTDLLKPLALMGGGLGLTAAGQMLTTVPPPPSIGEIASKWLTPDAITKAGALAKTIGETEYLGDFAVTPELQAYMDVSQKEIEKVYKRRATSLDTMGQAANPNWRNSGERLEMHRRLGEEEAREIDLMRSQWMLTARQDHATKQYNYVMQAIGADDQLKQQLLYGDVYDVMAQYQLDMDSVMEIRKIANEAGLYAFQMGAQSFMGG